MALLKVSAPKVVPCSQLIEGLFVTRYKQERVPLRRMYTLQQFAFLLGLKNPKLHLIRSSTLFGIEGPDRTIYVHPVAVNKLFKNRLKRKVAKLRIGDGSSHTPLLQT